MSPTPGGAGAAELVAYFLLDDALLVDELATFILLWRTVVFYVPIIVGGLVFALFLLYWAHENRKRKQQLTLTVEKPAAGV